jgi:hypothetical protein
MSTDFVLLLPFENFQNKGVNWGQNPVFFNFILGRILSGFFFRFQIKFPVGFFYTDFAWLL